MQHGQIDVVDPSSQVFQGYVAIVDFVSGQKGVVNQFFIVVADGDGFEKVMAHTVIFQRQKTAGGAVGVADSAFGIYHQHPFLEHIENRIRPLLFLANGPFKAHFLSHIPDGSNGTNGLVRQVDHRGDDIHPDITGQTMG